MLNKIKEVLWNAKHLLRGFVIGVILGAKYQVVLKQDNPMFWPLMMLIDYRLREGKLSNSRIAELVWLTLLQSKINR